MQVVCLCITFFITKINDNVQCFSIWHGLPLVARVENVSASHLTSSCCIFIIKVANGYPFLHLFFLDVLLISSHVLVASILSCNPAMFVMVVLMMVIKNMFCPWYFQGSISGKPTSQTHLFAFYL